MEAIGHLNPSYYISKGIITEVGREDTAIAASQQQKKQQTQLHFQNQQQHLYCGWFGRGSERLLLTPRALKRLSAITRTTFFCDALSAFDGCTLLAATK